MALERVSPDSDYWPRSHADHLARYLYAAPYVEGKRVLDAGTGPGYGAFLLGEENAREVLGVDIDEQTVRQATAAFGTERVRFCVDNCETLANVAGPFDVICNFENIEHLQHPDRFLERATALLAPDGVFLCSSPDVDGPYSKDDNGRTTNPYHVTEWSRAEFESILRKHFGQVEMQMQIQSLSCRQRQQAANNLAVHLRYLWSAPAVRLARGLNRLIGRPMDWPNVDDLGIGAPTDYPIMASTTAHLFGVPYCHYAICRNPRRMNGAAHAT